jgi:autotransporter translocation and assembly factor TamB
MDDNERLKKEIMQKIGLSSKEEAVAKGISDLSDDEKLEYFSNLAPFEDDQLALMAIIAKRYDIPWLQDLVVMKLKLRTSVNGWRANQIVAVATEKVKQERRSLLGRILRRNEGKKRFEVEQFE